MKTLDGFIGHFFDVAGKECDKNGYEIRDCLFILPLILGALTTLTMYYIQGMITKSD